VYPGLRRDDGYKKTASLRLAVFSELGDVELEHHALDLRREMARVLLRRQVVHCGGFGITDANGAGTVPSSFFEPGRVTFAGPFCQENVPDKLVTLYYFKRFDLHWRNSGLRDDTPPLWI
jgi:hypothetical protein